MASPEPPEYALHECCGYCNQLLAELEHYPPYVSVGSQKPKEIMFQDIVELERSALDGCHLCNLIRTEIPDQQVEKLYQHLEQSNMYNRIEGEIWIKDPRDNVGLHANGPHLVLLEPWQDTIHQNKDYLVRIKCFPIATHTDERRLFTGIAPSTASGETCNDIHAWLRICETEHHKCIERREKCNWRYPTRLLYVGTFKGRSIVRLCETQQFLDRPRYATLSHCWGGVERGKLTSSAYPSYKNEISMSELPRNFRDAIALTRTLAIEYLWIDSLCIIQDSAQDWQMECTWMTDIYAGSFINIGANASSNANGGIFCDRDPKTVMPLRASMNFKADDRLKGLYAILPISWKLGALEHAPLSKRSWTVQERLLSPRTIHSLSNKVIWDRPSLQASESDTTGLLEQTKGNFTMREWALSPLKEGNLSHRGNVCLRMWELAVKMYTRGELTFASDKLVAISGLARFLKDMWADNSITYLAGLWNYELEGSLTWHTSEGTPLVDDTYRAPSWSWAFVNGPITPGFGFPAGEGNKLPTKVLSVYTQPINDPFGPVNTGYMTLSSPLCRVQLQFSDDEPASKKYPLTLISTGHTLNFDYLYFDNRGIEGDNCRIVANSDYALAGIAKLSTTANLMEGLILHAIGSKAGQYIRIGFFEIESWGVVPEPNYDFVCPQCEYEKEVGEEDGFEDDHERIENAFKTMDLPPRMYEDKNMDDFTYRYEII